MPKTVVKGGCARFAQIFLGTLVLAGATALTAPTDPLEAVNLIFLGDSGTGDRRQLEVRSQMLKVAERTPLRYVVLLGDNIYGGNKGDSFGRKFLDVYAPLLARGIEFHSALGNHDVEDCQVSSADPLPDTAAAYVDSRKCWAREQIELKEFGYNGGSRYYSFTSPGEFPLVETFVLDSNTLRGGGGDDDEGGALGASSDDAQLEWLKRALDDSKATWKILAMHHPVHSPKGRRIFGLGHKPEAELREALERVILGKVDVVFQGHNHLYARMFPRNGIRYFVSGGGGQKPYRFNPDDETVARDDQGRFNHFIYTRVTRDEFQYCVIDKDGARRDGGWFRKGDEADTSFPAGECPPLATPGSNF